MISAQITLSSQELYEALEVFLMDNLVAFAPMVNGFLWNADSGEATVFIGKYTNEEDDGEE